MEKSLKKICIFCAALFFAFNAAALEVDEDEIRSVTSLSDQVEFINYGGPHAVIETVEAIIGIGSNLGTELSQNLEEGRTIQPGAKYSVIHAFNTERDGLLDADILILSEAAGVDHITNLRRIISGFLTSAYNYSWDDAWTVATFLTVYNAVYRGQLEEIGGRYKEVVLQNLTPEKAGLSLNWEDWAGNTQIIIPLRDITDQVSPIDTSTISDDKVIEALQQEPDKGIKEREKMADIKEREMDTASKRAQTAQRDAAQRKAAGDRRGAREAQKTSRTQQQIADKKRNEVQSERKAIEKDKEEVLSREPIEYETGLFGPDSAGFYRLINLEPSTGEIIKKSPLTQIRNKAVFEIRGLSFVQDGETVSYPQMFIAVCGENSGKSAVKLCLIDGESLEIKVESNELLSEGTDLVPYKDRFLVIISEDKVNYIASYDSALNLRSKSSIEVTPSTPLNLTEYGLLVTSANGNPCLLDSDDLSTIWQSTVSGNGNQNAGRPPVVDDDAK